MFILLTILQKALTGTMASSEWRFVFKFVKILCKTGFGLSVIFLLSFCKIERGERLDKRREAAFKEREETAEKRQREERWQDITRGWERKEVCQFIFSSPTSYTSHSPERYWRQSIISRFSFPSLFFISGVIESLSLFLSLSSSSSASFSACLRMCCTGR